MAPQHAAGVCRDQNNGKFTAQLDNDNKASIYKHLRLTCRSRQAASVSL